MGGILISVKLLKLPVNFTDPVGVVFYLFFHFSLLFRWCQPSLKSVELRALQPKKYAEYSKYADKFDRPLGTAASVYSVEIDKTTFSFIVLRHIQEVESFFQAKLFSPLIRSDISKTPQKN